MFEDEDQGFMLLVLGVLAAVLMTVLWYVMSDDATPVAVGAPIAAEQPADDDADHSTDADADADADNGDEEEAAAPTATAAPAPTEVPAPVAAAPDLEPVDLFVTVDNGQILLEGVVPSDGIRDEIATDAERIVGEANVVNLLEVNEGHALESGLNTILRGSVTNEDDAARVRQLAGVGSDYALSTVDELVVSAPAPEEEAPQLTAQLSAIFAFNPIKFASGSAIIEADSFSPLNQAAETLNENPDIDVIVEGHTDSQGDPGSNQTLSQLRAEAVVNYLVGEGVNPDQLTALGFGADNPIADNATAEGRAENRRIEFVQLDG